MSQSEQEISIIGVIPQYPKHSQCNVYAKVRMPPVGIISVLSQISHDLRFKEVYAVDENNFNGPLDIREMPDHDFLQRRLPAKIAMFYGGMSNSIPRMFSVAQQYKGFGAVTIAGGSHVDAMPEEALKSGIDIVVHGEGEETVKELLDVLIKDEGAYLDREGLAAIKGISFLDKNNKFVFTGKRLPIEDLDKLKDVDLTLIKFLKKRWSTIPVNKGRGCNWNCEFCVVNKQYGNYKACSVEKVMKQIIKFSDLGYKKFFFTDDNFAQNVRETIELCNRISDYKKEFNKKIQLTVQVRNEVAENDELILAMKEAGVTTLAIGYESPINQELEEMNKKVTVEKLIIRSRKLSEYFYLHGMFIFGYPGKQISKLTIEQKAKEYLKFFKKARIDTVQVLNAVPLPGSELRHRLEKEGRLIPLETVGWDKYDGLFLCYDPRPEGINVYDLQNLPKALMKKRYLGGFIYSKLNYGNWMNWVYNASIGFPIQFGIFYIKRFVYNLDKKRGQRNILLEELHERSLFYTSLATSFRDIKKVWRNLAFKTYAGSILKRWLKEYKYSDYDQKSKEYFD